MHTSARNVFHGKITAVHSGAVNDEVELAVEGGPSIVASITQVSTRKLGLKPGVEALALIKASFVLLVEEAENYLLSTRNQFPGVIGKVIPGAVNAEVLVDLPGRRLHRRHRDHGQRGKNGPQTRQKNHGHRQGLTSHPGRAPIG